MNVNECVCIDFAFEFLTYPSGVQMKAPAQLSGGDEKEVSFAEAAAQSDAVCCSKGCNADC